MPISSHTFLVSFTTLVLKSMISLLIFNRPRPFFLPNHGYVNYHPPSLTFPRSCSSKLVVMHARHDWPIFQSREMVTEPYLPTTQGGGDLFTPPSHSHQETVSPRRFGACVRQGTRWQMPEHAGRVPTLMWWHAAGLLSYRALLRGLSTSFLPRKWA